ncbi:hypothetical protein JM664_01110 [Rhodobacteraceae bacterium MCCB 386]|nr:hypothetical protein [Roseitranquillus sediminis]
MAEAPISEADARRLRWLARLVMALTLTMIVGVLAIVLLLVTRLSGTPALPLPEEVALPDGVSAQAVTAAADWYAVVTDDGRILIYERPSGKLRQEVTLD